MPFALAMLWARPATKEWPYLHLLHNTDNHYTPEQPLSTLIKTIASQPSPTTISLTTTHKCTLNIPLHTPTSNLSKPLTLPETSHPYTFQINPNHPRLTYYAHPQTSPSQWPTSPIPSILNNIINHHHTQLNQPQPQQAIFQTPI